MKNIKLILMGMLAILLTFGMGLTGCSSDSDGGYAGEEARHEQELADFGYTIIERERQVAVPGEWFHYVGIATPDGSAADHFLTLSHDGLSASIWFDTTSGGYTDVKDITDFINSSLALIPEDIRPALIASVSHLSGGLGDVLMISTLEATDVPFTISDDDGTALKGLFGGTLNFAGPGSDGIPGGPNPYGGIAAKDSWYLYTAAREPEYETWDFTVRAYPHSTVGTRLDVGGLDIFDPDGSGIPIPSGFTKEQIAEVLADAYNQYAKQEKVDGYLSAIPTNNVVEVVNKGDSGVEWPGIDSTAIFDSFGYHVYAAHTKEGAAPGEKGNLIQSTNIGNLTPNNLVGARLTVSYDGVFDTILFPKSGATSVTDVGKAKTIIEAGHTTVNTGVLIDMFVPKVIDANTTNAAESVIHFYTIDPETGLKTADDIEVFLNKSETYDGEWGVDMPNAGVPGGIDDEWTVFVFGGDAGAGSTDPRYHHTVDSRIVILSSPTTATLATRFTDIDGETQAAVGLVQLGIAGIADTLANDLLKSDLFIPKGYDVANDGAGLDPNIPPTTAGFLVSSSVTAAGTNPIGNFGYGNQFYFRLPANTPTVSELEFEIRNPSANPAE
ncbi:hypothetical protein FACS1894137_02740 [Spirochaetia bacterium]|nr:hypothetical protein FACS1894137_02740 [Spirochaetia bacterium]